MNNNRMFLFPSGASHLLGCILLLGMLGISVYDLVGEKAFLRDGNVFVGGLMLFLVLIYTLFIEACMMIVAKGHLFAYNVDKALCVRISNDDVKSAVRIGRRMYGPIFEKDCENRFSDKPTSPGMRNVFYAISILFFFTSLYPSLFGLCRSIKTSTWTMNLALAWCLVLIDAFLIVNRIFYRSSIRKFFAFTIGNKEFRSVLHFETADECEICSCPVAASKEEVDRALGVRQEFSWLRMIVEGIILIGIVVLVMNSTR